jgi:hypothetical protein
MTLEIQIMVWNRYKNAAGLNYVGIIENSTLFWNEVRVLLNNTVQYHMINAD